MWRISKALGWVPASATRDQAYEHLNQRVPDDTKCAAQAAPRPACIGSACIGTYRHLPDYKHDEFHSSLILLVFSARLRNSV